MMNREEAKYVINEIRWMDFYERTAETYRNRIEMIQMQIDTATDPSSPQGHEYIGEGRSLTFAGKSSYMNKKITERDELIPEYNKWKNRYIEANINFRMLLDRTEEKDFVADYFSRKFSASQLEEKYHISKPHRRIIQIVMNSL